MCPKELFNKHIKNIEALPTPESLHASIPISKAAEDTIVEAREAVKKIIDLEDKRLLAIVGPCSIHDADQALEYAHKLKKLRDEVKDEISLLFVTIPSVLAVAFGLVDPRHRRTQHFERPLRFLERFKEPISLSLA